MGLALFSVLLEPLQCRFPLFSKWEVREYKWAKKAVLHRLDLKCPTKMKVNSWAFICWLGRFSGQVNKTNYLEWNGFVQVLHSSITWIWHKQRGLIFSRFISPWGQTTGRILRKRVTVFENCKKMAQSSCFLAEWNCDHRNRWEQWTDLD